MCLDLLGCPRSPTTFSSIPYTTFDKRILLSALRVLLALDLHKIFSISSSLQVDNINRPYKNLEIAILLKSDYTSTGWDKTVTKTAHEKKIKKNITLNNNKNNSNPPKKKQKKTKNKEKKTTTNKTAKEF